MSIAPWIFTIYLLCCLAAPLSTFAIDLPDMNGSLEDLGIDRNNIMPAPAEPRQRAGLCVCVGSCGTYLADGGTERVPIPVTPATNSYTHTSCTVGAFCGYDAWCGPPINSRRNVNGSCERCT